MRCKAFCWGAALALPLLVVAACGDVAVGALSTDGVAAVVSPAPISASTAPLPLLDYGDLLIPGSDLVARKVAIGPRPSTPAWIGAATARQIQMSGAMAARQDLRFTDRQPESGIRFRHRITPDSAAFKKANHYDHGNGVVAADVDGDGLADLLFVSQVGPSGLFRNLGGGRFEDITESSGVALADRVKSSASFADLDNDGDADLVVTAIRSGNALLENRGGGKFVDVTPQSGLAYEGHSSTAEVFDYDKDGLLDVFVTNVGQFTTDEVGSAPLDGFDVAGESVPYYVGDEAAFTLHNDPSRSEVSRLYHNQGGLVFRDVTEETGLVSRDWNGDAVPIDGNGDGWMDLYLLNMQGEDSYFENQGGREFVDRSRQLFPRTPFGSTGGTAIDVENDGLQDLFVADMHSDMIEDVSPELDHLKSRKPVPDEVARTGGRAIWGNGLFRQLRPDTFDEVSDAWGVESMWPWGPSAADLNADGFEDLYVTGSMNGTYRYHPDNLFLNEQGKRFFRAESVVGIEPRRDGVVYQPWFAVDCALVPDSFVCAGTGLSGAATVWETMGSRSAAILDLDQDGDLDIVTNEWNSEPRVLVSDLAEREGLNWLSVELEGTASNRDGLGAVVSVVTADGRVTQVSDGQSGYLSQSSLPLYFGLGSSEAAGSVEVEWPSGLVQNLDGPIAAGTTLTVREGEP